jgi:AcrR family transcriptional regulator
METPATTKRGRETRERFVTAAAQLMADRGFHAVGINDIGAAAGVTGAALYRHFDTKTALLVAVFDRAVDQLIDTATEAAASGSDPASVLTALIAGHVDFALRDRAVLAVYAQEQHSLPAEDRRRLRRNQRRYVELWKDVVLAAQPALGERQALARVEGVFGLLNSVPDVSTSFDDEDLRREFEQMAVAALLASGKGPPSLASSR